MLLKSVESKQAMVTKRKAKYYYCAYNFGIKMSMLDSDHDNVGRIFVCLP